MSGYLLLDTTHSDYDSVIDRADSLQKLRLGREFEPRQSCKADGVDEDGDDIMVPIFDVSGEPVMYTPKPKFANNKLSIVLSNDGSKALVKVGGADESDFRAFFFPTETKDSQELISDKKKPVIIMAHTTNEEMKVELSKAEWSNARGGK